VTTGMNLCVILWLVYELANVEGLHPVEFVYMVFLLYMWHNNHFMHDLALKLTFTSVALVLLLFFIAPTG
jgi:hypothetical protein